MKSLSRAPLFETPWTVACQAPLSMGFSRQEYWSGLPFPSPGDLPNPGIEPGSPALQADSLLAEPREEVTKVGLLRWLGIEPGQLFGRQLCSPLYRQCSLNYTQIFYIVNKWLIKAVKELNWKDGCMCAKSLQSCPTLFNLVDCSLPGPSVHGDSPGKNTGAGCRAIPLQGVFPAQRANPGLSCLLHWQVGSLPLVPPKETHLKGELQFKALLERRKAFQHLIISLQIVLAVTAPEGCRGVGHLDYRE